MKKEINYIELKYTFDCGCDYEYRDYDYVDFIYKIDEEDAKYDILKLEVERMGNFCSVHDLIELFDNMCLWENILDDEDTIEWLTDKYEDEAMEWFKEEHYIESKEDYELSLEERG